MSPGLSRLVSQLKLHRSQMARLFSTATPEAESSSISDGGTTAPNNKHLKFTAGSTRLPVLARAEVTRVWQESPTVRCIRLAVHDPAFNFKAGQWVDMFIPGVETVGGFSMFSSPDQLVQQGIIDLGVKFSRWPPAYWVHDQCRIGSEVTVRVGGDFFYAPEAGDTPHDLLLVAGGVGVNPLVSMFLHAAALHNTHTKSQQELHRREVASEEVEPNQEYKPGRILMLYSARTYRELLYKSQLSSTAKSTSDVELRYFTTREPPPDPSLATYGHISPEVLQSTVDSLDTSSLKTFICGPPPMIESINELLLQCGLGQHQILYEKWW